LTSFAPGVYNILKLAWPVSIEWPPPSTALLEEEVEMIRPVRAVCHPRDAAPVWLSNLLSAGCLLMHFTQATASDLAVVKGIVADARGAPIAGAEVTLEADGVAAIRARTARHGNYRFPALRPFATYRISAGRAGYRGVEYDGLRLESNARRTVNFRLKRPGERDVIILTSRDPFPDEDLVRSFSRGIALPAHVIDLDAEADPKEAVRHAAAEKPDLILTTGLRAARLVRETIRDVPALLTLISDPRRYDLQATNTCFLMNNPDPADLVRHAVRLLPSARRVGVLYDAHLSALLARDLRAALEAAGLQAVLLPCRDRARIGDTLSHLTGRVDALLVPYDPLTAAPGILEKLTSWALRHRVPLLAPGPEWVRHGALLSYGVSQERLGDDAAILADEILFQTRQPSELGLRLPENALLAVNRSTARTLGLALPPLEGSEAVP
jgi:ABC-type uncharacterized transport system substrate-binding protein